MQCAVAIILILYFLYSKANFLIEKKYSTQIVHIFLSEIIQLIICTSQSHKVPFPPLQVNGMALLAFSEIFYAIHFVSLHISKQQTNDNNILIKEAWICPHQIIKCDDKLCGKYFSI